MTHNGLSFALAACLGIGVADLIYINGWVAPQLFESEPPPAAFATVVEPESAPEPSPRRSPSRSTAPGAAASPKGGLARAAVGKAPAEPATGAAASAAVRAETAVESAERAAARRSTREAVTETEATVYFSTDRAHLDQATRRALDRVAERLRARADLHVAIAGHADVRGSESHNLQLSRKRADAVAQYLRRRGVTSAQIGAVAQGESMPVDLSMTRAAHRRNRRVEIRVEGAQP